jgi:hypothetical protein
MKTLLRGGMAAMLLVSAPLVTFAFGPRQGGDPTSDAMGKLANIFAQKSFSATAVMSTSGGSDRGMNMEFNMAMSGGKTRVEMDMSKMMGASGGAGIPGMDKIINITLPTKKVIYQIIPGMKGYCEMPILDGSATTAGAEAKVVRKSQGMETVEGYVCEKMLTTVTSADGTKTDITTWEAKPLGGIPVKTEIPTADGKMTMLYKNIKTSKPADSLFEIPAGLKKYGSMQELMMSGMMQMMPQSP